MADVTHSDLEVEESDLGWPDPIHDSEEGSSRPDEAADLGWPPEEDS